jgi:hypothetical protein
MMAALIVTFPIPAAGVTPMPGCASWSKLQTAIAFSSSRTTTAVGAENFSTCSRVIPAPRPESNDMLFDWSSTMVRTAVGRAIVLAVNAITNWSPVSSHPIVTVPVAMSSAAVPV